MTQAPTLVAQASLGILLHLDENITRDNLDKFPLAEYAAEHRVVHSRFETVSRKLEDGMKRLFDPNKPQFAVWVWIHDPYQSFQRPTEQAEKAVANSRKLLALCRTLRFICYCKVPGHGALPGRELS